MSEACTVHFQPSMSAFAQHMSVSHLLLLSMLHEVHCPMLLVVSQFHEPLNIICVIASPVGGKEVSKDALYEKLPTGL